MLLLVEIQTNEHNELLPDPGMQVMVKVSKDGKEE